MAMPQRRTAPPKRYAPEAEESILVLDVQALDDLANAINRDSMDRLIDAFVEDILARAATVAEAACRRDLNGLAEEVHSIKSTAGHFGAAQLVTRVKSIESACRNGDADTAFALAGDVPAMADEVVQELESRYRPS